MSQMVNLDRRGRFALVQHLWPLAVRMALLRTPGAVEVALLTSWYLANTFAVIHTSIIRPKSLSERPAKPGQEAS